MGTTPTPLYWLYCLFLALMGIGIGGNLPIDGSLFLEFIPLEQQKLLTLLSVFWPIGFVSYYKHV